MLFILQNQQSKSFPSPRRAVLRSALSSHRRQPTRVPTLNLRWFQLLPKVYKAVDDVCLASCWHLCMNLPCPHHQCDANKTSCRFIGCYIQRQLSKLNTISCYSYGNYYGTLVCSHYETKGRSHLRLLNYRYVRKERPAPTRNKTKTPLSIFITELTGTQNIFIR